MKIIRGIFQGRFNAQACLLLAIAVWVIGLGLGLVVMGRYENRPGAAAAAPRAWPSDTKIPRLDGRATLVMFAHPRCPCTRASMSNLTEILNKAGQRVAAYVVFYLPANEDSSWCETDTWRSASQHPAIQVIRDPNGAEAKRFGVTTSGDVLVFNAAGTLTFDGGITAARGHLGASLGSDSVEAILAGKPVPANHTPVFGCDLFVPATCPACEGKEVE